jgi:hypothetical protein
MPVSLPYLVSYKNVPALFEKIASAKIPDKFSREFLSDTIGLKASNDRSMIPLLRTMGFIDQSGTPTDLYRLLKSDKRKQVLAGGVRRAYGPLFDADQNANALPSDKLKSLVAQVAGTDDTLTSRISGTFNSLVRLADWTVPEEDFGSKKTKESHQDDLSASNANVLSKDKVNGLRTEFHYNIQVHLPANGTEEVYLNIFNALRKTFQ